MELNLLENHLKSLCIFPNTVLFRCKFRLVGRSFGEFGEFNAPWGVKLTAIPVKRETEIAEAKASFDKVCQAFGLRPVGEAGWHLVTVAGGG